MPSVSLMQMKDQVREFLMSRRSRLQPRDVGITLTGPRRRVPGLRREEVAMLAGMSVDYYVRLERGNLAGVSRGVLDAVARALCLTDFEHAHLLDLARVANSSAASRQPAYSERVRPKLQQVLDALSTPAWVRNGRADFLAANTLGRALYAPVFSIPSGAAPNTARFLFLDPVARDFFPDWEQLARQLVAVLRAEAGRHPFDRPLTDLIGELSVRSPEFRVWWANHEVFAHRAGLKRFHHPVVGDLELSYESSELTADNGLTLVLYSAEPGSKSEQGLALLASWEATERRDSALSAKSAGVDRQQRRASGPRLDERSEPTQAS